MKNKGIVKKVIVNMNVEEQLEELRIDYFNRSKAIL